MNNYLYLNNFLNQFFLSHPYILESILLWSVIWQGFALWKAAQRKEKLWFIVFLFIHTIGLLEILYLFIFSRYERKTIAKDKQIMEIKPEEKG